MTNFSVNKRSSRVGLMVLALSLGFGGSAAAQIKPAHKPVQKMVGTDCVPLGSWVIPGKGQAGNPQVIAEAAKKSIVLLGETHINADHHRWQLQTLAALHAIRPNMVIGFEMFPRRVQKVLDQWIAGKLTEREFLAASEWDSVWNTDADLYLPLFHFARMNRIPM
ncbi:MAG: ChaN family lipoprotein, partial [Pseudomonadota bacterium]